MTYNELKYVITIHDEKNFSLAAKKLYISQSALSQSIQKTENAFGFPLFIRNNTGAKPTKFCQQLVELARPVMEQWDQFVLDMNYLVENQQAELTVGMSAYFMKNVAPYVLPVFHQRYPKIKLKIIEERTKTSEHLALHDVINLCIQHAPLHDITLGSIPLCATELLLAVPANHPFCSKHPYNGLDHLEIVELSELRQDTFALMNHHTTNYLWDKLYATIDFQPIVRQSAFYANIKDYILHDSCVGFLNELMVRHEPDDDKICYYRIANGLLTQDVLVSFAPDKRFNQQEQRFINVVKEVLTSICCK